MNKPNKPQHFLTGLELSPSQLRELLAQADELRRERKRGIRRNEFAGKSLALLFEKPSLRTHMSFSIAMQELGGIVVESFAVHRKHEEPEDVSRVVGGYCDAIMLRTHAHETLERMALRSPVPVINGLSDTHHPCQILADLLTLKESFGGLEGLTLAYIGDGNNILHSLLLLLPKAGVSVRFACPRGYAPDAEILAQAQRIARETGASIEAFAEPRAAVMGVHAVYTDVWTSMGFEDEAAAREEAFRGYQLNAELFALADPSAIILHCLPMIRGKEITDEMADHPRSAIFRQSENRLHAQKALLLRLLRATQTVRIAAEAFA